MPTPLSSNDRNSQCKMPFVRMDIDAAVSGSIVRPKFIAICQNVFFVLATHARHLFVAKHNIFFNLS